MTNLRIRALGASLFCVCLLAAASSAFAVDYQGKKIAVVAEEAGSYVPVAIIPATSTAATADLPLGYKSKANVLDITASVQIYCTTDDIVNMRVTIGAANALPDNGIGTGYTSLEISNAVVTVTRNFIVLPESAGGPAIAAGTPVELKLASSSGTCSYAQRSLVVRAAK